MTWKRSSYIEVQSLMKPGDIIAFAGDGVLEEVMKLVTNSKVSHVAVVFHPGQFIEAIANGVRIDNLGRRIDAFDGEVWWLPLSMGIRERMDLKRFYQFLLMQEHKPFEIPKSILEVINSNNSYSVLQMLTKNKEDVAKFCCSQLAAGALVYSGALDSLNTSEVTPGDLCRLSIYDKEHYQIKGQTKILHDFNTVSPEGFKNN